MQFRPETRPRCGTTRAAIQSARAALQVHGAIGYTWEADLQLWMKKAWALQRAWGDATFHRRRVAESLDHALAQKDADAGTLNGLAWTCATGGVHLEQARLAAERAVALEPKNAEILDTLAEVHYRSGNAAKAIEVETQALSLSPNDPYLNDQIARRLVLADVAQVLLGHRKRHVDGHDLVDRHERRRIVGFDQIAELKLNSAGVAVDR